MLIIPVSDSRRFPWLTLLLILLNCGVYFVLQHGDQQGYMGALSWARSSGLLKIELQVYQEFLQRRHEPIPDFLRNTEKSTAVFQHLAGDDQFQCALRKQILIPPADPRFADWLPKRQVFEAKLNQIPAYRFGYSPARKNYPGIITYMFFHQGIIRFIGNMLFLWFIGSWMEIGAGRCLYLNLYLLTGGFSALTYGFLYPLCQGPLLGAAGAIAGLMGAYLLLYGGQRSRIRCSLGFCGGHTAVFGWFLFPFWLSKEVYLYIHGMESQESCIAQLGGLLAGLLFAAVLLVKRRNAPAVPVMQEVQEKREEREEEKEQLPDISGRVLPDLSGMPETISEGDRKEILRMLEQEPENLTALVQLFRLDKRTPNTERFHRTAGKLLRYLAEHEQGRDIEMYFQEYQQASGMPRLQPPVLLALARAYIASGKTARSGRFLLLLLKQRPGYPGLPSCLFKLACAYREQGNDVRAEKCFQLICRKYPQTLISQEAEEQLTLPYRVAVR
ncbi:MAG: rhomboid family intramembrane serine protease [Candidatus Electrothrix sp. YB6]